MRMAGHLGRTVGGTRVEERRRVFRAHFEAEALPVLLHQPGGEVALVGAQRDARSGAHAQYVPQARAVRQQLSDFGIDVEVGSRAERHEDVRVEGADQFGDVLVVQLEVDGAGNARGLGSPQGEVRLRKRQQQRHAGLASAGEGVKQVSGTADVDHELGVGPVPRGRLRFRDIDPR